MALWTIKRRDNAKLPLNFKSQWPWVKMWTWDGTLAVWVYNVDKFFIHVTKPLNLKKLQKNQHFKIKFSTPCIYHVYLIEWTMKKKMIYTLFYYQYKCNIIGYDLWEQTKMSINFNFFLIFTFSFYKDEKYFLRRQMSQKQQKVTSHIKI